MDARRAIKSFILPLSATLSACGLIESSNEPVHQPGEILESFIQKRRLDLETADGVPQKPSPDAARGGSEGSDKWELERRIAKGFSMDEALANLAASRIVDWRCKEAEVLLRSIKTNDTMDVADSRAYLLARALRRQGRFVEALAILEPVSQRATKNQANALFLRIHVLRELGRFSEAFVTYEVLKGPKFAARVKALGSRAIQKLDDVLKAEQQTGRRQPTFSDEIEIILRTSKDAAFRRETITDLSRWKKPPIRLVQYALIHDEDVHNRRLAMRLMLQLDPQPWRTLEIGLSDRNPLLRRKAASLYERGIPQDIACLHLHRVLLKENDPATFRQIHKSLCAVSGRIHLFSPGAEKKAEERDRMRENWRKFLDYPVLQRPHENSGTTKARLP